MCNQGAHTWIEIQPIPAQPEEFESMYGWLHSGWRRSRATLEQKDRPSGERVVLDSLADLNGFYSQIKADLQLTLFKQITATDFFFRFLVRFYMNEQKADHCKHLCQC